MFTRSIVIQRRVEDLQLGVESYQKRLNLTKPDLYRSDLKRKEAYTAYSNPQGFIYQNKDKRNRLMRIDELHKFSDGTLTDVHTTLDDRLKGIRMQYLPQSIWRKSDKDRAAAMIQAINKRLKTRRIMRSLERPSDTPVCYLCTCEECENILNNGTCLNCNSGTGNSFTYDPIPESFDEVQIIPNPPPQFPFNIYLCQICESNSYYGYECSQRVLLVYEPEPCYIQNFSENDYSHDLPSVDPLIDHHCCYECENSLNDFFCPHCTCEFCGNECGVPPKADHCQPPQYTVNHPIFNDHNDFLNSQNELTIAQNKLMEQMTSLTSLCEMACQIIQKKQEERQIEEEKAANAQYWKILACCDDDDDYNSAITPNEPVHSLSMRDEHLNTILETETDEFINFTTFSNVLFDADYEFDSVDDQSLHDEEISEKIFSNPLFEEEIIPMKIDQHHFNAESDLIESLLNHIRLIEKLLYENSSPRPLEEFVSENSNAETESFSPSPIPFEDSDSFMKEIDLSFTPDDPMPPGIEENDDDSERDILIHEELLDNYSLSVPVIESYHFDIPSFSRPPAKPPDGNT
nr:hypothetical protein [Tanacetum cinerariifolium]